MYLDKDNLADPNENYHILETEIINQIETFANKDCQILEQIPTNHP